MSASPPPHHPHVRYRCSFCGKNQEQVHRLIAGPGGVYICDECVELCQQIISDEREAARRADAVRARIEEPSAEFDRDTSCILCGQPLQENDSDLIVGRYETGDDRQGRVVWKCHTACFRASERN